MLTKIVNGETVELSAEEEAATIAEWDANLIATTEERRVQGIKAEANRRIIALDASWTVENHEQKQRNFLMAGTSALLNIAIAFNSGVQNDVDSTIATGIALAEIVPKIEAIRNLSNLAEDNGDTIEQFILDLDAL